MSGMGDIGGSNLWDEKIAKYLVFFGLPRLILSVFRSMQFLKTHLYPYSHRRYLYSKSLLSRSKLSAMVIDLWHKEF